MPPSRKRLERTPTVRCRYSLPRRVDHGREPGQAQVALGILALQGHGSSVGSAPAAAPGQLARPEDFQPPCRLLGRQTIRGASQITKELTEQLQWIWNRRLGSA